MKRAKDWRFISEKQNQRRELFRKNVLEKRGNGVHKNDHNYSCDSSGGSVVEKCNAQTETISYEYNASDTLSIDNDVDFDISETGL